PGPRRGPCGAQHHDDMSCAELHGHVRNCAKLRARCYGDAMLSEERHQAITAVVHRRGTVTVTALSAELGVSEATIRRDLDLLDEAGSLRRVRGGATARRGSVRPEDDLRSFADVAGSATAAKQAIAARACDQVRDGDVIALDIGTTVAAMCPLLAVRSLSVVTVSLSVVRSIGASPYNDIVIVVVLLLPNYYSMVVTLTESALGHVRVVRAFLGAAGVRAEGAVLDSSPSEV